MRKISSFFPVILLVLPVILISGKQKPEVPPDEVKVQLGWYHQAQWAGFYSADQNGLYTEEGISIKLMPRSSPRFDTIGVVVEGGADFGTHNGVGMIIARLQGRPVVAVAAIYRRDPFVFMTLPESGITKPRDFPGHTIRTLNPIGSGVVFRAMMNRLGLDPDSVIQVDTGYDMTPFYAREVDIWPGFLTDEVLSARENGYDVNVILPGYYGVHLYGMTIFTTEENIRENPELVERFLQATLRGYRWAIDNPDEAAMLTLKYNPELDIEHERALMQASIPLIHTGEGQIGWMEADVWEKTHNILIEQGLLDEPLDVDKVYTTEFLQNIYGTD